MLRHHKKVGGRPKETYVYINTAMRIYIYINIYICIHIHTRIVG